MELLSGRTLGEELRARERARARLPLGEVAGLLLRVVSAVGTRSVDLRQPCLGCYGQVEREQLLCALHFGDCRFNVGNGSQVFGTTSTPFDAQ